MYIMSSRKRDVKHKTRLNIDISNLNFSNLYFNLAVLSKKTDLISKIFGSKTSFQIIN